MSGDVTSTYRSLVDDETQAHEARSQAPTKNWVYGTTIDLHCLQSSPRYVHIYVRQFERATTQDKAE